MPAAIALADLRLVGSQGHQAGDRLAGPLHRPRFDRLGHGIERHHHGGFREAADQEGARDRHAHQRIDVEPALAQGREALAKHGEARQGDGGDGDPDLKQLMTREGGNDQMQQLRCDRQRQGARQAEPFKAPFGAGLGGGRPLIGADRLRGESQPADCGKGGVERCCFGIDRQNALGQQEPQAADAVNT